MLIDRGKYYVEEFEKKLYIVRKIVEKSIRKSDMYNRGYFYTSSLSSKVIIYKGLLLVHQIGNFYKDLQDTSFKSALALVHQFSNLGFGTTFYI